MTNSLAPYAKAVTGALVAGLATLGTALTPDAVTAEVVVTAAEWVAVISATLTASLLIWAIPNADTDEQTLAKAALAEKRAVDNAPDGHQGELFS